MLVQIVFAVLAISLTPFASAANNPVLQADKTSKDSEKSQQITFYQDCLLRAAMTESSHTTLEQIRQSCKMLSAAQTEPLKPLEKRRLNEVATQSNPFVITPHKLNYAMFTHFTSGIHKRPFEEDAGKPLEYRDQEMQFQLSFKIPLITQMHFLGKELDIYGAYTNRSFWQLFDDEDSIPFRETNHEPELWAQMHTDIDFFDFNLHTVSLGVNHQSNGQSNALSRGWNRLFLQAKMQHDNSTLNFKTWARFDEQDEFDNSFNYTKYLGDFEIEAAHRDGDNTYALTLRNSYKWNQYGAVKFEFTHPLTKRLKGYIQYFNGYGDSLIELEHRSEKVGFGIVLVDRF
ncbi:phospholipase A [Thiomicrorhabdus indica]|uniref:phospholipase A n=1 Tax=Thiomicrorhabdus indica TaxID=2267253 RepID=UPI002AA6027E|nr:phospholipase A [Thiomicrorhabdus indica]